MSQCVCMGMGNGTSQHVSSTLLWGGERYVIMCLQVVCHNVSSLGWGMTCHNVSTGGGE